MVEKPLPPPLQPEVKMSLVPFPKRTKSKENGKLKKIIDIFKSLHVNIPFLDSPEQMTRHMKAILSKKRRVDDHVVVAMIEICSVVLEIKLLPKLKEPSRVSIPCSITIILYVMLVLLFPIQKTRFGGANAYYNYSAIGGPISYLSKSYSRKCFGSGLESILPADFIVVVIKEDGEVPIIMGRLFLAIS